MSAYFKSVIFYLNTMKKEINLNTRISLYNNITVYYAFIFF